jgi:ribosomal protein S18 acetylase RimI-like enzyme
MNGVELFGLAMSATIALSLTQKSVLRLRLINLVGSIGFVFYGLFITSYPVIVLNAFTTLVNIWYLRTLLNPQDVMEVLNPPPGEMTFINHFLEFNREDIRRFNPRFHLREMENNHDARFFPILRNGTLVSIVVCRRVNKDRWEILLDYVIPPYRDLRCGKYFYSHAAELLKKGTIDPIRTLVAKTTNQDHIRYLNGLGFIHEDEKRYILPL